MDQLSAKIFAGILRSLPDVASSITADEQATVLRLASSSTRESSSTSSSTSPQGATAPSTSSPNAKWARMLAAQAEIRTLENEIAALRESLNSPEESEAQLQRLRAKMGFVDEQPEALDELLEHGQPEALDALDELLEHGQPLDGLDGLDGLESESVEAESDEHAQALAQIAARRSALSKLPPSMRPSSSTPASSTSSSTPASSTSCSSSSTPASSTPDHGQPEGLDELLEHGRPVRKGSAWPGKARPIAPGTLFFRGG